MLAIIPLIPLGYAAAVAGVAAFVGWASGRVKKGGEIKKQDEKVEHLETMVQTVINKQILQEQDVPVDTTSDDPIIEEPAPLASEVLGRLYIQMRDREPKTTDEILSQDLMKPSKKEEDIPEDSNSGNTTRFELMDL